MNSTLIKIIFVWFMIIINPNIALPQEKRSPDTFNGFRDFEFYKPITDYFNYNYKKVGEDLYEIVLPLSESSFLDTRIRKIIIGTYKSKIHEITLILEDDIENILKRLFRHDTPITNIQLSTNPVFSDNSAIKQSHWGYLYKQLTFRGVKYACNTNLSNDDVCVFSRGPSYSDVLFSIEYRSSIHTQPGPEEIKMFWSPKMWFIGKNTHMVYGDVKVSRTYYEKKGYTYRKKPSILLDNPFLSFLAVGYKGKIDGRQVLEHYDSYLRDFGIVNEVIPNDFKSEYKIPLFKMGNSYLVRAIFGDTSGELILDTGADYLIISPELYNKLKTRGYVTEVNSTQTMVLADGTRVTLRKVMVKNLQINDLKVDYIEAFVNTANISLLGQNFFQRFGKITIDRRNNLLIIEKQ